MGGDGGHSFEEQALALLRFAKGTRSECPCRCPCSGEQLAEDIHGKLLHLVASKLFCEMILRWLSQSRNLQVVVDQVSEIAVREISLLHSFEDCDYTFERS